MADPAVMDFAAIAKGLREREAERAAGVNTPSPEEIPAPPPSSEPINYTWGNIYAPVALSVLAVRS